MTMSPGVRKLALTVHLTSSVGWIGVVIAYLALGALAVTSQETDNVRAAWIAMEFTGWYAIVSLAAASLVTGLVMSLATPWGLFRHYWVLISLALTLLCTVVLVLHMPSVSATADALRAAGGAADGAGLGGQSGRGAHGGGAGGDLFHPGVGLIVLLAITVLNVYKPRGLTPYGWRKQHEERAHLAQGPRAVGGAEASSSAAG